MTEYDPNRPFRVGYSEPVGRAPERLGARSKTDNYPTLEEARTGANCLSDGCKFIRITDGPDRQLIEYQLEP